MVYFFKAINIVFPPLFNYIVNIDQLYYVAQVNK